MQAAMDTGSGHGHLWVARLPLPGPLLTAAVRVAVVARAAAVTMRAIKLGPARAAASLVAALGQRPCWAAATHYRVERHTVALSRAGQAPGPTPTQAPWGGPAHAGRAGSGSNQENSGHTRRPQSLLGSCTGRSHAHRQRPALQGWNTGRLQGRRPTPVRGGPAPSIHRDTGLGVGLHSRWQPGPKNPGAQSSQWVPWKLGLHTQRPTRGSFRQALPWVPAALQSQSGR